jgi:hypothetical protein
MVKRWLGVAMVMALAATPAAENGDAERLGDHRGWAPR